MNLFLDAIYQYVLPISVQGLLPFLMGLACIRERKYFSQRFTLLNENSQIALPAFVSLGIALILLAFINSSRILFS